MSFLIASPEALAATATYLTGIGSAISAANAVAAAPTTEILAAGTDEVSTAISALFGAHAQAYQALSAHVAAFHDQFVHTLTAGAGSYMAAEAAAASPLQALQLELLNAINAPTLALLGRPLIGDGTDAAPGRRGGRRGRRQGRRRHPARSHGIWRQWRRRRPRRLDGPRWQRRCWWRGRRRWRRWRSNHLTTLAEQGRHRSGTGPPISAAWAARSPSRRPVRRTPPPDSCSTAETAAAA